MRGTLQKRECETMPREAGDGSEDGQTPSCRDGATKRHRRAFPWDSVCGIGQVEDD